MATIGSGSNVEFILNEFNKDVTLDLSGEFDTGVETIASYDTECEVQISLSKWSSCFKIQSDSVDINDVENQDITYFVYNASDAAGMKGTGKSNNASLAGGADLKDGNPAMSVVSGGPNGPIHSAATNNELEYDFVRNIANDLFNTHHGVDLFKNETPLRRSVEVACDVGTGNLLDKLQAVLAASASVYSAGSKVMNDSAGGSPNNNLTYILLKQMFSKQASRFSGYAVSHDVATPSELPWQAGDKICYVLTVKAAPDQHKLVRTTTDVADRKYLVKMVLTA
jgi:hypothetical protein